MSVSRMAVSQGNVVSRQSAATIASSVSGRSPSLCARKVSASSQTVRADCTINTGQKSGRRPAASMMP